MDVDARLEAVEEENDMLRAQVEQLEALLGFRTPAPIVFQLTGTEARVFGVLFKRDLATKDLIMSALYGNRPNEIADPKIVDVFICKMRAKLKRHHIPIETVWGRGYRMTPDAKRTVRDIMEGEGLTV